MPIHTQAAYITMNYKYFTYRPKFGILIIRTRPIKESVVRITWAVLEKLLCKSANLYVTAAVKTYTSPVKIGKFTWIGGSVILSGVTHWRQCAGNIAAESIPDSAPLPDSKDAFLESMAEAGKSVADYLDGNILYINVMNRLSVDCDCDGSPAVPDCRPGGHDGKFWSDSYRKAAEYLPIDRLEFAEGSPTAARLAGMNAAMTRKMTK